MKKISIVLTALLLTGVMFSQGNGYLGISMEKSDNSGVRISEILENGSAKVYGLKQNDIILEIDGVVTNTAVDLKNQITAKYWGETITIRFIRNGKTETTKVTLGNRADRVTYRVKRTMKNSTVLWNFDNNVWITVEKGVAVKMIKLKEDNKSVDELLITDGEEVPQRFSDLNDKLEIIEAINKRNEGKKVFPTITVFIKTYPQPAKIERKVDPSINFELKAFPNPSLGEFKFTFKFENATNNNLTWEVIDVTGKKVASKTITSFEGTTTQSLDLTAQSAGVYLLKIVYNNQLYTERLVIK